MGEEPEKLIRRVAPQREERRQTGTIVGRCIVREFTRKDVQSLTGLFRNQLVIADSYSAAKQP